MLDLLYEMKSIILFTIRLTIGFTMSTVGKATTKENAHAGSHKKKESFEIPIWWKVTMADTIPDMNNDRKKLKR